MQATCRDCNEPTALSVTSRPDNKYIYKNQCLFILEASEAASLDPRAQGMPVQSQKLNSDKLEKGRKRFDKIDHIYLKIYIMFKCL